MPHRYSDLRERKIDLILGRTDPQIASEDIETEILFDEPLVVAAGTRNPWVRRREVSLAELVNEPWALPPPDTVISSFIVELFHSIGLEAPRTTIVCHSIETQNALLASGPFLAMVPRSVLAFGATRLSIKVLHVDLPMRPPPVGVMLLKNRTISPVAKIFIDCAREVAKPLCGPDRERHTRGGTRGA